MPSCPLEKRTAPFAELGLPQGGDDALGPRETDVLVAALVPPLGPLGDDASSLLGCPVEGSYGAPAAGMGRDAGEALQGQRVRRLPHRCDDFLEGERIDGTQVFLPQIASEVDEPSHGAAHRELGEIQRMIIPKAHPEDGRAIRRREVGRGASPKVHAGRHGGEGHGHPSALHGRHRLEGR